MPNRINVDIPHTSLKLIYSKYMTKKPKVNMNFKLFQITYKNDNQTDSAARTTETGKFFFFLILRENSYHSRIPRKMIVFIWIRAKLKMLYSISNNKNWFYEEWTFTKRTSKMILLQEEGRWFWKQSLKFRRQWWGKKKKKLVRLREKLSNID